MSYSKEYLSETVNDITKRNTLPNNKKYEWVDLVGIPQRPEFLKNSLYCASYSDGKAGWDDGFDRRPIAIKVSKDKNWDLASDINLSENNHILEVESIYEFGYKLYKRVKNEYSPYIIGVTGSVGKTTTVAFLEHLLNSSEINTVRFYSKRLTPLSVMCHFINRVDTNIDVIVMEYSAYMKNHVEELSKLLSPNLSFLINIYETHINQGMFSDKKDIFESKIKIKNQNNKGYLNIKIIDSLGVHLPKKWNEFCVEKPEIKNQHMPPTMRTSELYTVGKIVSKELSIPHDMFTKSYESFVPKEKRIIKCNVNGKTIYFHGETSGGSRLYSWFETNDMTPPWFFVEELNFADENPEGFKPLLKKVFQSERTFILDNKQNRERINVNANFLDKNKFFDKLKSSKGYIVYHKALATRNNNFSVFDYLKNILS